MWDLSDLQQAADDIYKRQGLGALDRMVMSPASRLRYRELRDPDERASGVTAEKIPDYETLGFPDNWIVFVYGTRLFGVDLIAHTHNEIFPWWNLGYTGASL